MNGHELLDKLSLVNDRYIMEADERPRKQPHFRRWGGIAAVFCLVVALGIILPRLGGSSSPGDGGAYTGHEGPTEFMRYEGPILPLTTWEETPLTAERDLTMDFGIYGSEEKHYHNELTVKDSYVLTNSTDGEITAMVSYPVIGSFREAPVTAITVDGQAVESELQAGMYSGSFRGAGYETTSMNLSNITSWEGYRDLLQDGSYMAQVQEGTPALDTTVTVYEISGLTYDPTADVTNPNLKVTFDLPKDTISLSYGFNGEYYDPDGGINGRTHDIPREGWPGYGQSVYLIFLGEDVKDLTTAVYPSGHCVDGEEMDFDAQVDRYETSLGAILDICATLYWEECADDPDPDFNRYFAPGITQEMYLDQVRRYFAQYGVAGSDAKERYQIGMLENIIGETVFHTRILYHTFPVTVGAGSSITVDVTTTKLPSFDFDCTGSENAGIDGYDMVTQLGSPLTFTGQSAAIAGYDHIDIVRQNFGFDILHGVTEVDLDMAQEHYYIEIRQKATN